MLLDIVHERKKKKLFPQGVIPHSPPKQHEYERKRDEEATRMETSDLQQQQQQLGQQGAGGVKKQNSPSSSPEVAEAGFVMVPPSLAGDSSKHKTNQVAKMN